MDDDSAATSALLLMLGVVVGSGREDSPSKEAPPLDPSIATWAMYFPCSAL